MEQRTQGVPTRRVLKGDDGAPLDGDRVLAVALRWADRPLSLEHVKVGQGRVPLEGVEIRWEGVLPIVTTVPGSRAWIERSPGHWVDAGRRTALELGEILIIESGELTLEARLQRRSELLPPAPKPESLFFGLVMAHASMIFIAIAVAMVITPRTDEPSMWGAPSLLKRVVSPFMALAQRKPPPVLEERINDVVKNATFHPLQQQPQKTSSAADALKLLFGGGGGGSLLARGASGIDSALNALGGPSRGSTGLEGIAGRDLGPGAGNGGLSLGQLPGGPGPRGPSPLMGLRGHRIELVVCGAHCLPKLPPGYDRELVLKVVRRHQNEIRFCYESELQKAPDLAGKVTVAWTIGGSGAVEAAQIAESGLGNANVESCIVQKVRRWTFPEPAGGQLVEITFPWVFQVAGSE